MSNHNHWSAWPAGVAETATKSLVARQKTIDKYIIETSQGDGMKILTFLIA